MKTVAFVPARAGSKRLPNKNVRPLAGKPLLVWTLEACVNCPGIDEVIFSTDSDEYWEIARGLVVSDKLRLDRRSADEAGDQVRIFDFLRQQRERLFGASAERFVLALPTAPLRTAAHLSEALALATTTGRPVFSATAYGFPISFAFALAEGEGWHPAFDDSPMVTGNTRSQNQPAYYHPNGAIYVRPVSDLADPARVTLYTGAVPYVMDRWSSIDIDQAIDFRLAESLLEP